MTVYVIAYVIATSVVDPNKFRLSWYCLPPCVDPVYIHHSSTAVPLADQVNACVDESRVDSAAGLTIAGDPPLAAL